MSVNSETFKAVMGQWPSGVTVVTTQDEDGPGGMTASSFSSVSLEPPLVSICVARPLAMHDRIQNAGRFAVNILSKDKLEDGLRFAGMLPDVTDRFEGIDVHTAATGCPLLHGVLGWLDCKLWATHDGGDHSIFVGQVLAAGIDETATPLLYHSRSWGQFADVLADSAVLSPAGQETDALVLDKVFGDSPAQPASAVDIVDKVRSALSDNPQTRLLVLDDARAAADPLLVRQSIQAIAGVVGKTAVGLRAGRGPMALANVVVALKSGIHQFGVSPDDNGPYVAEADLRFMLERMDVNIRS